MSSGPVIRRLTEADAAAYRDIRLEALRTAPTAFGSSYETENERPVSEFAGTVARNYVAGAWIGDELVGTAGFYISPGPKNAHRGNIWGVFLRPAARGQGLARLLMDDVLAHARTEVEQVHLCVVTDNAAALALYEHLGFTTYGTEPRSLLIDGRYYDEHLMVLRFDA